jgi:DNA adenine methylase
MGKNKLAAPVLKWVGGKRQLIDSLTSLLPKRITTYCEPFVGGGALLFALQPNTAYINDINDELINVYSVIKSNVEALVEALQTFSTFRTFT